jgi:putative chitobiose transport system substrate-binding protein
MKKRLVLAAVAAITASFGIAGVGLMGVTAQSSKQLEFYTTNLTPFGDFFNPLVERYQRANPGNSLKWTDLPANTIQQKILAGVAAGNPADAVQINAAQTIELAQQGALLPLNDLLDAKTIALYQKTSLAPFSFEGKLYALPDYATPRVIAYNSDLLKKAGIEPGSLPKTIPGLIDLGKKIKDKTGVYGYWPLIDGINIVQVFQESGLPILNDKRNRAVFNSADHIELLQTYMDLRKKDYFPEDVMRKGFAGSYELYSAGKLGVMVIGSSFITRLEKDNNAIYKATIIGQRPVDPLGNVLQASTFAYAVPKGVKDPKAAAMLAHYLTNDDTQLAFSKRTGTTFPTTVKAARDPFFTTPGPSLIDTARIAAARTMRYGRDLTVGVPNASVLNKAVKDNIEAAIFGQKSAKAALDDAVKIWNANL